MSVIAIDRDYVIRQYQLLESHQTGYTERALPRGLEPLVHAMCDAVERAVVDMIVNRADAVIRTMASTMTMEQTQVLVEWLMNSLQERRKT